MPEFQNSASRGGVNLRWALGLVASFAVLQILFVFGIRPHWLQAGVMLLLAGTLAWELRAGLARFKVPLLTIAALAAGFWALKVLPIHLGAGYILFLAGAAALWLAQSPDSPARPAVRIPGEPHPLQRWEPWFFAFLALAAAGIRLYHLGDLPAGCAQQEGEMLGAYFNVLVGKPLTLSTQYGTAAQPTLMFYQAGILGNLFGFTPFVLRLMPVFYGVVSILAFYFVARQITSPLSAALAALLFTASHLHLVLSRTFYLYTILFIPITLAFGLWLLAQRKPRWYWYALAGAALGLSLHGYLPGRGAFFVFAAWFILLAVFRQAKITLRGQLWFWGGFLAVALPVLIDVAVNIESNWSYVRDNADPVRGRGLWLYARNFYELLPTYAKIFSVAAENNYQYQLPFKPLLDPLAGALFGLGLGLCALTAWRPTRSFLLIFLLVGFLPAMFSSGSMQPYTPNIGYHPVIRRICLALPAVYLIIAVGIDYFRALAARLSGRTVKTGLAVLAVAAALTVVWQGAKYYFIDFAQNPAVMVAYYHKLFLARQEMLAHPGAKTRIQQNYFWENDPRDFLLPRGRPHVEPWSSDNLLALEPGEDALLMLEPYMEPLLPFFKQYFPHAEVRVYREARGAWPECQTLFFRQGTEHLNPYVYAIRVFIPRANVDAFHTLWDTSRGGEPRKLLVFDPQFAGRHAGESLRLTGAVISAAPGEYRLSCAWRDWTASINGRPVAWDAPVRLLGGVNEIALSGRVPAGTDGALPLQINGPGGELVAQGQVTPIQDAVRMRVDFFTGDNHWAETPVLTAQDLFPIRRFYSVRQNGWQVTAPVFTRMTSALRVPADGTYEFSLMENASGRLYVNGREIFNNFIPEREKAVPIPIALKKGVAYDFQAQFQLYGTFAHMTFCPLVKKPGEKKAAWAPWEWFTAPGR